MGGAGLEHPVGPGNCHLLDDRPRFSQCGGCGLSVAHDLGIDLEIAEIHRERNPPTGDAIRVERELEFVRDRGRVIAVPA